MIITRRALLSAVLGVAALPRAQWPGTDQVLRVRFVRSSDAFWVSQRLTGSGCDLTYESLQAACDRMAQ